MYITTARYGSREECERKWKNNTDFVEAVLTDAYQVYNDFTYRS